MKESTRLIGLDLLRIWMTFSVIAAHAYDAWENFGAAGQPWYLNLILCQSFAVPVFMMMTFLLSANRFATGDGRWLGRRLLRLYLPFAFWAIVTFVLDRMLFGADVLDQFKGAATFHALGIHLIGGTALAFHMQTWFMAVLCWLTAAVFLLFRGFKGKLPVKTLAALFLLAYVAEYTGLNKLVCGQIAESGIRIPVGRIVEMIPYVAVGLLGAALLPKLRALPVRSRVAGAAFAFATFVFMRYVPVFVNPKGFAYCGGQDLAQALPLLVFFILLPLDALSDRAVRVIRTLSGCTMGVYMTHFILYKILSVYLYPHIGLKPYALAGFLLTTVLAWTLCLVLARIPSKFVRTLVT